MKNRDSALTPRPIIVLAYSGGLDTSVIVPWLRERYDARVVCMVADVGQPGDVERLPEKAVRSGAVGCEVLDLKGAFVADFIWPTLRAGALYARKYLLGTAMARPLIAKRQAELALRIGADALAHGCTGKGNDQVRFELTYAAFAPQLPVIVPWREWSIESREEALVYAMARDVAVEVSREEIYSRDGNLWHLSHEGGPLEDPNFEAPEEVYQLTTAPEQAPDVPGYVTIEFESGYPVALNGEELAPVELVKELNRIGGVHGVGRADIIEDRLVGMKSRGIYETPGGTLLFTALRELESLVLDRRSLRLKDAIASRYADLVYEGRWWSAERKAMDAMVDSLLEPASGAVRLKLYKGSVQVATRQSPNTLYEPGLASFGVSDSFDHADAAGFVALFGLPLRVEALRDIAAKATDSGGSGTSGRRAAERVRSPAADVEVTSGERRRDG